MKWKRFAFNHVPLHIPEEWDLTRFSGNAERGNFALDDGERQVLDAQWGPCGRDDRSLLEDRLVLRQKGVEVKKRFELDASRTAYLVQAGGGRMAQVLSLQEGLGRFVLLRLFSPQVNVPPFCDALTRPLEGLDWSAPQRWEFFSTAFELPAGWLLSRGEMKAGCVKLAFGRESRVLTLWDVSLLDQLEKRDNTLDFARRQADAEYRKRLKFFVDRVERGADRSEFAVPGRRRRRWLLSPMQLLFGNRKVRLECVVNRAANRFSLLLLQYRRDRELAWLGSLAGSLREGVREACSNG